MRSQHRSAFCLWRFSLHKSFLLVSPLFRFVQVFCSGAWLGKGHSLLALFTPFDWTLRSCAPTQNGAWCKAKMAARVVQVYEFCVSWLLTVDCYRLGVTETPFAETKFCRAVSLPSRSRFSFPVAAFHLPWKQLATFRQCK